MSPDDRDRLLREQSEERDYARMVRRVCQKVQAAVPRAATVLVACEGEDDLLRLDARTVRPFPQTRDGQYDRQRPANGAGAVAQLESLRAKGAQFLVWPEPAFWWLTEYPELRQHLDVHYPRLHADADCIIYQVGQPGQAKAP